MKNYSKWKPEIHLLIPYGFENDEYVSPLYDTPAFRAQLDTWFEPIGHAYKWQQITFDNLDRVIAEIAARHKATPCLVFNLCDGDEITGYPGISVVRALEKHRLPFTGADSMFYEISTSKVAMKYRFTQYGVPTAPYVQINDPAQEIASVADQIGYPFILKPDISASSYGIGLKSVVRNPEEALAQAESITAGPYGEFFATCGLFAERFITGPEFTALVVQDSREESGLRLYPITERVFHSALPPEERFLSYDRYWEHYEEETPLPPGEPFYRYEMAEARLQAKLSALVRKAFHSVEGIGYGRVDLRMDKASGEIFVLEVNANCGLSYDDDSSTGRILQLCKLPMYALVEEILHDAFDRAYNSSRSRQKKARLPRTNKTSQTTRSTPTL